MTRVSVKMYVFSIESVREMDRNAESYKNAETEGPGKGKGISCKSPDVSKLIYVNLRFPTLQSTYT